MNILIFLGPAGSGKGTQAQFLKEKHNYYHISTGDLLRSEVASNSVLGLKVSKIIDSGNLVSDEIMIEIIKSKLVTLVNDKTCNGVVFDGFPRTKDQAVAFDALIKNSNLTIPKVIYFELTLDQSIERISGRMIDSRNNDVYHKLYNPAPDNIKPFLIVRDDDSVEKVKHRYKVYQSLTEPLKSYYEGRIDSLDCNQSIDKINIDLESFLSFNNSSVIS